MSDTVLLGREGRITAMARETWEGHLSDVPQHSERRLGFMSEEHHLVRYFVVRELSRAGNAIEPEMISQRLKLPVGRVNRILDELERHLFFLVRNGQGAVTWAFPLTVETTPHELIFSTGERLHGA
jgi:hypothetical protein